MQYTTNYNLITVEGTDVVNPLVQMNPNFTDIDAAMFANKQATIGTATEITAGTVHSITRNNTDSNYFRFTATSNWTAGDTMSLDGVSVSVYLPDGTAPLTGSYVINSEVFGIVSGSRVTLFLANPVTSLDADNITFDPTGTGFDPSDTDVDKALKDLDTRLGGMISITKIWENLNPGSSFIPQNITLDSGDYDLLLWVFGAGAANSPKSVIVPKGSNVLMDAGLTNLTTGTTNIQRNGTYVSDTSYSVSDGSLGRPGSPATTDNTVCKPLEIYGIKF